jgi:hypothetical protein
MKESYVIRFNFPEDSWVRARQFFFKVGLPHLANEPKAEFGYTIKPQTTEELEQFLSEARQFGFDDEDILVRRERTFTPGELTSALLLHLIVSSRPRGTGGPALGTRYDLSEACENCGSGAKQVSELILDTEEVPTQGEIFETLSGEILVSSDLGQELARENISGLKLVEALSPSREPTGWVQLVSTYEMPPMDPSSEGIVRSEKPRPCSRCQRDGYYGTTSIPETIKYRDVDVQTIPDVVHTWERFGQSRLRIPFVTSQFAPPLLIVKPKVYEIFRRRRVGALRFIPVEILNPVSSTISRSPGEKATA